MVCFACILPKSGNIARGDYALVYGVQYDPPIVDQKGLGSNPGSIDRRVEDIDVRVGALDRTMGDGVGGGFYVVNEEVNVHVFPCLR